LLALPGGRTFVSATIEQFRSETPHALESLRGAITVDDRALMHRLAHTLKSTSALLGMAEFARSLERIEARAESGTAAELDVLYRESMACWTASESDLARHTIA
jgi:HPt (histidine-containing phosphotransfer) domain-containing protein